MKIHDFNLKMAFKTMKYLEITDKGVSEVETANQQVHTLHDKVVPYKNQKKSDLNQEKIMVQNLPINLLYVLNCVRRVS